MVPLLGVDPAYGVVSDTYRAFHIFRSTNPAVMLGWPILAFGAYKAGVLGGLRSAALALMVMLPFGTLKGTEIRSIAIVGLCIALVPLGVQTLREGAPLTRRARFWIAVMVLRNITGTVLARIFPALNN